MSACGTTPASLRLRSAPNEWGTGSGPLSLEQVDQYRRDGYLLLTSEAMLTEHLDDLQIAADALLSVRNQQSFITEPGQRDVVRSVFSAHRLSAPLNRLCGNPLLVNMAMQLLSSSIYIHQSHLNYKLAWFGTGFFWHQDFVFWRDEDGMPAPRAITAVSFLDPVTTTNGPMLVIDGSHRWEDVRQLPDRLADPNRSVRHERRQDVASHGLLDPEQLSFLVSQGTIRELTGPAGAVLLFDPLLAHASTDNLSQNNRKLFFCCYNSTENVLRRPMRPEYITERNFSAL